MTIHKSKGLEFDTVIIPGLDKGKRPPESELIRMVRLPLERVEHTLMAAVAPTGEQEEAGSYLAGYRSEREKNETRRLLYVASTRARKQLHLLGQIEWSDTKQEWKTPRAGSMLHALWDAVSDVFLALDSPAAHAGDNAPAAYPMLRRVESGWQTPPEEAAIRWRAGDTVEPEAERHTYEWVGDTLRHVGVVVHTWLTRIAEEGLEHWGAGRVRDRRPVMRAQLATLGVSPEEIEPALDRVERALVETLADERGRWVLTRHADDRREFALTAATGSDITHHRVDCTFVDEHGDRWVIDFKTSTHEGGGLEAFLNEEQRRYREQLERYARVVAPNESVRLGLYFPLLGAWREWSAPRVSQYGATNPSQ
jgi:ATP-dependent helicase/nuclease subunit A